MLKTRKYHSEIGCMTQCEYSSGWFMKFKRHDGLQLLKFCGETADVKGVEAFCEEISELINQEYLTMDQIYNADETLLFWHYIPKIHKDWLF